MTPHVDNAALREAPSSTHLALRLRQLSEEVPIEQVTNHLLAAVRSEALPPDVYTIYISSTKSPAALAAALRQPFSRFVRYAAIKQFGNALKKSNWESVWTEVGGTQGLLQLFSELSVFEVDLLCKVIGWAAQTATEESTLKQQRVTELLQGLLPIHFPNCPFRSQDDRPLHNRYARLLPACTSEFIQELLIDYGGPFELDWWPVRRVALIHWPMIQELITRTIKPHNPSAATRFGSNKAAGPFFSKLYLPYLLREVPQTPGHTHEFTASMSFSLEILKILAHGEHRCFDHKDFGRLLVMPLLRRALSRKAGLRTMQEILDLVFSYLKNHPQGLQTSTSWHKTSFFAYVVKAWSTHSRVLEKQLVAALKLQPLGLHTEFPDLDGVFNAVHRQDRYDLLWLIFLHTDTWKANINDDADLQKLPIKQWPLSVFQRMPSNKAHELLLKLIRLKPKGDFLQRGTIPWREYIVPSVLAHPPLLGLDHGDPLLLSILLSPDERKPTPNAQKAVEIHRDASFKSRDQVTRAFHAKSAAFYAIASGSLGLYAQILTWFRRYVRDPLTLTTIYNHEAINTKEGIALLSGIPEDLTYFDASKIRELVVKANEILVSILETGILAVNEPAFNENDWEGPKTIFWDVVAARIMQSCRLENALRLNEDLVYDILWSPTLEMLLNVEKIGLQPRNKSLGFNSPSGPLFSTIRNGDLLRRPKVSATSYRFLDNLAKARNDLWVQHRLTLFPDCASLPKEWPRGLPIQHLLRDFMLVVHTPAAERYTQYLSSRSAAIAFLKHNPVVNENSPCQETRAAISGFVDGYQSAVELLVLQQKPGSEQENRASAIMTHFIELYCNGDSAAGASGRPTRYEAAWRCKTFFTRELYGLKVAAINEIDEAHRKGYPVLPDDLRNLDLDQRLEWNPFEGRSLKPTTRQINTTLLDCLIDAKPLEAPHTSIQTHGDTSIWERRKALDLKHEGRAIEENTVMSTLLYLGSIIAKTPKIMTSAFPSAQDMRYPPLFLDQEFLEEFKDKEMAARQAIFCLRHKVPSTLLQVLCENALDVLDNPYLNSADSSSRERTAYGLLRLLMDSDRPELATHGILNTLINRPEASSWHRQLLKKSFVRNLSKHQARNFLNTFVSSIHAKIDEQTLLRKSKQIRTQTDVPSGSPLKPIIKITTIKLLAQFLDDLDAISTDACFQILSDLLVKSSHVDVRIAVIESLVSRATDNSTDELEDVILQALEKCIPSMGSLNGSGIFEEEGWKMAEQTDELPEIVGEGALCQISPIFDTFCSKYSLFIDLGTEGLMERVLVPALLESQVNHSRWVAMFAKKYEISLLHQNLPGLPVHPQVMIEIIKIWWETPSWILDVHHQHALINLRTPEWLVAFNQRLRNDPVLHDSNAVRYWLSLYDRGPDVVMATSKTLVNMLRTEHRVSAAEGNPGRIQISQIQKCLVEQANALLWLRDPDLTDWTTFISHFELPLREGDSIKDRAAWLANSRPVVEQIIASVNETRDSSDWQREPYKTKTPFLPSLFPLRLLLLDYPQLYSIPFSDRRIVSFSEQVLALLREVQSLGLAHRGKLTELTDAANKIDRKDQVRLACLIGEIKEVHNEQVAEWQLRAELAESLVRNLRLEREEKEKVTDLLGGWVRSRIEGVRLRGVIAGRRMGLDVEEN